MLTLSSEFQKKKEKKREVMSEATTSQLDPPTVPSKQEMSVEMNQPHDTRDERRVEPIKLKIKHMTVEAATTSQMNPPMKIKIKQEMKLGEATAKKLNQPTKRKMKDEMEVVREESQPAKRKIKLEMVSEETTCHIKKSITREVKQAKKLLEAATTFANDNQPIIQETRMEEETTAGSGQDITQQGKQERPLDDISTGKSSQPTMDEITQKMHLEDTSTSEITRVEENIFYLNQEEATPKSNQEVKNNINEDKTSANKKTLQHVVMKYFYRPSTTNILTGESTPQPSTSGSPVSDLV